MVMVSETSIWIFYGLAFLQGTLFMVDEFYFHLRRGLPRWERVGHPVDSFFFLLPLGLLYLNQGSDSTYWGLTIFSCLIITKDEFVHAEQAQGGELWLHALLFILHPVILIFAAWTEAFRSNFYPVFLGLIGGLMLYQVLYWNWFTNAAPRGAASPAKRGRGR